MRRGAARSTEVCSIVARSDGEVEDLDLKGGRLFAR